MAVATPVPCESTVTLASAISSTSVAAVTLLPSSSARSVLACARTFCCRARTVEPPVTVTDPELAVMNTAVPADTVDAVSCRMLSPATRVVVAKVASTRDWSRTVTRPLLAVSVAVVWACNAD